MNKDHQNLRTDPAEAELAPYFLCRVSPHVYAAVAEAVQEGGSDLASIARMIEQDQHLRSLVLDFTNSATHALPQRVESVRQAVALLGAERLRQFLGASIGPGAARTVAGLSRRPRPG